MDENWISAQKATLYSFFPGVDFVIDDAGFQIGFDRFKFVEKDVTGRKAQVQARINYLTDGHSIVHNEISENLFAKMLPGAKHCANMVFFVTTTMPDGRKHIELRCDVWNKTRQSYDKNAVVKSIIIGSGSDDSRSNGSGNRKETEEANAKMELYRQAFVEMD